MSSYEYLLSLDPLQALVRMVNDANQTTFRLDRFLAGKPTVVAGVVTRVVLTGISETQTVDDQSTLGSFTLTYERLQMADFLKDVLGDYHPYLPMSSQNILDEITARIGQKFYIDDIVLEEVTRDTAAHYRLKAKPESLRFVGYIDLPLVTLTPVAPYLPSQALVGVTDERPVVFPASASLPYINATDYRAIARSFAVGELAQDRSELVTLFNAVVPDPDRQRSLPTPWYVSSTPGPFNLMNATVTGYTSGLGLNTAVPSLDRALTVQLDGDYATNFATGTLSLPYSTADFNAMGYTNQPRVTANSIVSLSDGSDWNIYLNHFQIGDTITSFMTIPSVLMDGTVPWVADWGAIAPTNLYGAVVVYNGQLRGNDIPPAKQGLDRVLVVQMPPGNAVWKGEHAFYYSSPIKMRLVDLVSTVGSTFYYAFVPYRGNAPYRYVLTQGNLPVGLGLNADGTITGTATLSGASTYDVTIIGSDNVPVVFRITHRVTDVVRPLKIEGLLPTGTVDVDYSTFLDITGGIGPYTNPIIVAGNAPLTIRLEVIHTSIRVYGTWPSSGVYYLSIGVTSADGQSTSISLAVKVEGTAFQPLLRVTTDDVLRETTDSQLRAWNP